MKPSFENIADFEISMDDFRLYWRFTDEKYDKLPEQHLNQLIPLRKDASMFLWNFVKDSNFHKDIPFNKDFFTTIDKAKIFEGNEKEIKKWLYQ